MLLLNLLQSLVQGFELLFIFDLDGSAQQFHFVIDHFERVRDLARNVDVSHGINSFFKFIDLALNFGRHRG